MSKKVIRCVDQKSMCRCDVKKAKEERSEFTLGENIFYTHQQHHHTHDWNARSRSFKFEGRHMNKKIWVMGHECAYAMTRQAAAAARKYLFGIAQAESQGRNSIYCWEPLVGVFFVRCSLCWGKHTYNTTTTTTARSSSGWLNIQEVDAVLRRWDAPIGSFSRNLFIRSWPSLSGVYRRWKASPRAPGIFCLLISSATAAVGVRKYRRELQLNLIQKKHRSNTLASLSFVLENFECQNERTLV